MSIPYVTDGVTEMDSALFNPWIDRLNGVDGWAANARAGIYNVLDYGAVGDGVTDDTAAIQATCAAAEAGNGFVYSPPGQYAISDLITVPQVSFIGAGPSDQTAPFGTKFLAIGADAKLLFSSPSRTRIGGFSFDGDGLAAAGVVGLGSHKSHWSDIYVHHVAGTGFRIHNVQNAQFDNIDVQWCVGGIWVDDGCGSCLFNAPAAANNTEWQLRVSSSGAYPSGYDQPTAIKFVLPMFEWIGVVPTAAAVATVWIEGGERIMIEGGNITNASSSGNPRPTVKLEVSGPTADHSTLYMRNTQIIGDPATTTAFEVSGFSSVTLQGGNAITGAAVGFALDGVLAHVYGDLPPFFTLIATQFTFSGGAFSGMSDSNFPIPLSAFVAAREPGQILRRVQNYGESGVRFYEYANGVIGWGDGTGYTPDTNLYRGSAALLRTDGGFMLDGTYDKPLRLGDYRLWVNPGDGKLYIKASAPASATDGTVVGSQS